jgi:hypothetical protein
LVVDSSGITFSFLDFSVKPNSFYQAFDHPDIEQRIKWTEAILKERKEIFDEKFFESVKSWSCQTFVHVLRINGVNCNEFFRVQLVVCVHNHIPGIDFQEILPFHTEIKKKQLTWRFQMVWNLIRMNICSWTKHFTVWFKALDNFMKSLCLL